MVDVHWGLMKSIKEKSESSSKYNDNHVEEAWKGEDYEMIEFQSYKLRFTSSSIKKDGKEL